MVVWKAFLIAFSVLLPLINPLGSSLVFLGLVGQAPADVLREEAVRIAKDADLVVATVGLSPSLEGEEMPVKLEGFSGGDRTSIDLPKVQQQLLEALRATGKPVVVVLLNGSAIAANYAAHGGSARSWSFLGVSFTANYGK